MKSIRQLLRQPVKTLFGVALIALAVAVLSVCLGQSFAAAKTEARLNETFRTAVFPTVDYKVETDQWAMVFAKEHPEIVEAVSDPGLASAYIPALTPDNYAEHYHISPYVDLSFQPYDCAMLEITLTEIGEPAAPRHAQKENGTYVSLPSDWGDVVVSLTGTVDKVIGLQEGYPDCLGFTARITLYLESMERFEELELTVGDRYLVYSSDFQPSDFLLRSALSREKKFDYLADWHPIEPLHIYLPEELLFEEMANPGSSHVGEVRIGNYVTGVRQDEVEMFRAVDMVLRDKASYPQYHFELGEDGQWVQVADDYYMTGENGGSVPVTQEEFAALYTQPTIAKLDGSAEEFLNSTEGVLWKETLNHIEVNNHAFPVIGVDSLDYLSDFLRRMSEIPEGRNFTAEELTRGARVCIVSQTVAEKNSLSVGDTINLHFYDNDPNLPGNFQVKTGAQAANPMANYYSSASTPLYEQETYTIIGIYTRDVDWDSAYVNKYAFTPNAIFAPKASINCEMEYGYTGFYRTLMLRNGTMDEFADFALEAGFATEFNYYDNGYSAVENAIDSYKEVARQAMLVGVIVYGIILLLFLMMFPGQQGKVLAIMDSLGADRSRKLHHVIAVGFGILIPGTVIGTVAGMLLWQAVVDRLTAHMTVDLAIELNVLTLAAICLVQLILAVVLLLLIGIPLTRRKGLAKPK